MEPYIIIIFRGRGWGSGGISKKGEMGAEAWIYFCHQWLLVSVGQLITSSRILSKPVKPRKLVKYRKPDLPKNHYYQLLFKPVSPMVQYVVLPPCLIQTSLTVFPFWPFILWYLVAVLVWLFSRLRPLLSPVRVKGKGKEGREWGSECVAASKTGWDIAANR